MAEAGRLAGYLVGQFSHPRGMVGWLAGQIMAARGSNRVRNRWTVELMALRPGHRVLEIGHGPGVALAMVSAMVPGGRVVGLDHSRKMCSMAEARNNAAIGSGILTVVNGSAASASAYGHPALSGPFDRIFAVNVAMFWSDPVAVLRRLAGLLAPGGAVFMAFQPRTGPRTDDAAIAAAENLAVQMRAAGLAAVRIERLTSLSPMPVCVIGAVIP